MSAYGERSVMDANPEAIQVINDKLEKIKALYAEIEKTACLAGLNVNYEGPAGKGDSGTFYPPGTYDWNDRYFYGNALREPDINDEPLWMPSSQEGC